MKKVCFFSGDITRSGGTEKVACQVMSGLSSKFHICVVSLYESSKKMFFPLPNSINRTSLFQANPNGIKNYISIVSRLRKYVTQNDIDVLIDVDSILDMFSVTSLIHTKTKLISWEHFNFYESMGNQFRVPIRKHITKYADCVVTLTKEDKSNFITYFRNKLNVVQIYNPIENIICENRYNINSKTIISVGRLAKQKGFDYLIEVAKLVFSKYPDWQWLILGEGEERKRLEEIIEQNNLTQVKFVGRVSNVGEYLEKSAIFVLTSRYEGFPLVLIEAKSHNLPIVSFECKTGPSELIENDINGYLIDCFNIEKMADKICKLIASESLRKEFSGNSKLNVDQLQYESIIKQWISLIEEI